MSFALLLLELSAILLSAIIVAVICVCIYNRCKTRQIANQTQSFDAPLIHQGEGEEGYENMGAEGQEGVIINNGPNLAPNAQPSQAYDADALAAGVAAVSVGAELLKLVAVIVNKK